MPWIYNLITLVIVLVFFFIYHRLTANNRSLEKVKKLAERLEGELGVYVETRAEELKHYGIDLDVQQKAAKIALEKLQASQVTLAEKSEAIGAIAERFKEYDDVLAKLMAMTARVDENLSRVHEEAAFAEGVNRKLDLSKKGLAAIERELPLLRESFAQDAQKTIDGFRDGILQELQGGLDATEAELKAVKDEAMAAFDAAQGARALVNAELEKALETAAQRSASVEDQAFATLKEASEARLAQFEASLDDKLAQADGTTADRLTEMKEAVEAFKKNWESEAQSMLAEMRARLEEADGIFARKAAEIATLLGSSRDKAEEAEISLSKTAQDTKASLDQSLGRIKEAEKSIDQSLETTKMRIEEDFADFGQAFEERRTSFEENFMAETKAMGQSLAALKEEVEGLKTSAYTDVEAKLSGFEDGLLTSLSARKSESFKKLDMWLSDLEKTLSGIAAEASARRESEEGKKLEESRAHLLKVRDELHAQLDRMGRDIDSLKETILEQNQEARKMLNELAPSFEESARALFDQKLAEAKKEGSAKEDDSSLS
ncbi:MAG: hypothetical protein NT061_00945 [Spirochaetes bacterium]|nr:hypothetical protein [Spirochaetota bacterium]